MRILLISLSPPEAAYLHKALRESAHSLQATDDLRDGLYLASQDAFDVVLIVALDAPSTDELAEILPEFSRLTNPPTLMAVLGRAGAAERVRMLRAGADACFVQPYSFIEMQERMLALHRARGPAEAEHATDHALWLDSSTRELVEGKRRLLMTKCEFLLVECLLRQINAPVAREHLIRYAWPDKEVVEPSSVNLVVSRLRRRLEQFGFDAQVETVSRFGYQISKQISKS
jgi:two-component system, OmpR family, response regulator